MAKPPLITSSAPDPDKINPKDIEELVQRGWLYYGNQKYDQALADFSKALIKEPDNPDIIYALGIAYKASGSAQKAIETFEKALLHLDKYQDAVEARMLLRLIHGHINQLKNGDWNLEKEIWHYVR
ncbi:MAG: tetratricopeptide repeat protein [Anaerolineaceae bacterium]|jgi:tetratricopeptide (TPR) repeat protein